MPRIRRYHPVSHDFVRDPEVQELRRRFGDWTSLLWLEMLSIADRNSGHVKGDPMVLARWSKIVWVEVAREVYEEMTESERRLCKWSALRARKVFDWMVEKAWVVRTESGFFVRNYAEYHKTREQKKSHAGTQEVPSFLPSLPSELTNPPKVPSAEPAQTAGSTPPPSRNEFDPDLKVWLLSSKHLQPLADDKHADFWDLLVKAYDRYPWLYFEQEITKADAWIESNGARAPTPRGLRRFMRSWLEKAVEFGRKQHG